MHETKHLINSKILGMAENHYLHKILLLGNIQPLQHDVFKFNMGDDSLLDTSKKSHFHTAILLSRHSESEEIRIQPLPGVP